MKKLLFLAGAGLLAASLSATAAEKPASKPAETTTTTTHSMDSMMAGSHAMAGDKQHHMSDRMMPSHSRHCTEEALAKMPADHRAACGK